MKTIKYLVLVAVAATVVVACKKDKDEPSTPTEEKSSITFMIDNQGKLASNGGMVNLDLDEEYLTPEGDTLKISEFKMYLSEFTLIKEDDSEVSLGETYFLISQTTSNDKYRTIRTVEDIPAGTYKALKFSIGVPNNCNTVSPCTTGDLDPFDSKSTGMIWDWSNNSGYKFLKFEGDFRGNNTSTTGAVNGAFSIHIATSANFKTVILTGEEIVIEEGKSTSIHMMCMLTQLFMGPNLIDMEEVVDKSKMSENYANGMFMLHHVMNPSE